jgi:alanyl-tRNA synthetase
MGFERLCMVLQGVQSNYDTDVFTPIIREIETITDNDYGEEEKIDIAIRVISDHVRAVAFAIADGQLPSNNGAGYVIRRILRRAIRYGFTFLNKKEPFIFRLVDILSKKMGNAFPELKEQKQLIQNVIQEEELSFLRTLEQGLVLLDAIIANNKGKEVSGKKAFELKDTYGFPEDLTELILNENGMSFNEEEFKVALDDQRDRARKATAIATDDWTVLLEDETEEFVGYDSLEVNVKLTKYRKVSSKKDGDYFQLVFNQTPFYPEGGGQVGDKGYLEVPNGDVVYIVDTKKENNLIVHVVKNLPKHINETFRAVVDKKQRHRTACNHTATHLLHQALREVLGIHVEQKGSAVHSKNLRFDFSHFSKMTLEELRDVENFVNARIEGKLALEEARNIPMEKAIEDGAMALFGEKYGDNVRTIRFGQSIELCGGTHVQNTGDIWHFKIKSESAVAAGIRRIEAITADATKEFYFENNRAYYEIKDALKNPKNPLQAIVGLQEENVALRKQIESLLKEKAGDLKAVLKGEIQEINGINFLAKKVDLDAGGIKTLAFELGGEIDNLFLLFGSDTNGKAILTCYIDKKLVADKSLNAGTIVRELGKHIQGGGGGQPFFATAGGKNPEGIAKALREVKSLFL